MTGIVEITQPLTEIVEIVGVSQVLYDITGPPVGTGSTGAFAFQHIQDTAATVWTMTHSLGWNPAGIVVISDDGYVLDGFGVQYLMPNMSLRLSFDISVAGVAYLS
jgi:hypothetical protein